MQEPPPQPQPPSPLAIPATQEKNINRKRALPSAAGASPPSMDAEVVEIPPSVPRSSKSLKQKEVFVHEVIDIDSDEDVADSAINEEDLNKIKKGKAVMDISDNHMNGYSEESFDDDIFTPSDDLVGAINGSELNGLEEDLHTAFNGDGQIYDLASYDDDYMDYIFEEVVHANNDYDILQAHFDSMDIPPGVEAPVPWLPGMSKDEKNSVAGNNGLASVSLHAQTAGFLMEEESFGLIEPAPIEANGTFSSTSIPHGNGYSAYPPSLVNSSTPSLPTQSASKKNRSGSQRKGSNKNFSFGLESFKNRRILGSFRNKKSPVSSGNSTILSSSSQLAGANCPYEADPSIWNFGSAQGGNKMTLSASSSFPSFPQTVSGSSSYQSIPHQIFSEDKVSSLAPFKTWLKDNNKYSGKHSFAPSATYSSYIQPFSPSVHILPEEDGDSQLPQSSSGHPINDIDDVLRRFENFKHFDTLQDHSDHHYSTCGSAAKHASKGWAKRIQEEWKILEKDLPDTIFVRVYETRIDLLRAVIVGAEGTPYHDGLYFFDILFPPGYPNLPPLVYYHSGGLRLNPNLYNCGKVCLSLLNTWSGHKNEKWMPGVSTMLQVLVSIQGLILNEKPYFNEPGYESTQGSANGEKMSLKYNEDTFILSLRTMTYLMKRPPENFEDFVVGHFFKRAQDILMACKAYREGAQVGCLVKGHIQDVDAGDKSCSTQFKDTLSSYIGILAKAFMKIGVTDCEKFLSPPPPPAKENKRQVGGVTIIDPMD